METPTAPTLAQYAFACCFLSVGPAMGALAATLAWARGRRVPFVSLATLGASWAGWMAGGVVAAVLFPTYPRSGVPSEPVAVSFLLPGFVTGGLALCWVAASAPRMRWSLRAERGAIIATIALAAVLSFGIVRGHEAATTWPARRHLPSAAVVIDENILVATVIGDFRYDIEARMTEAEFETWMGDLRMHACPTLESPHRHCGADNRTEPPDDHGSFGNWADGVARFSSWSS